MSSSLWLLDTLIQTYKTPVASLLEHKDGAELEIHDWVDAEEWDNHFRRAIQNLRIKLKLESAPPATDAQHMVDPMDAADYLRRAMGIVEEEIRKVANKYPKPVLLWYARRLPQFVFEGELATTAPYDQALLEVCTGKWGNDNLGLREIQRDRVSYIRTPTVISDVLMIAAYNCFLSDIHSYLRYAGKGVHFDLSQYQLLGLPGPRPTSEEKGAIELFDQRVAADSGFDDLASHAGTPLISYPKLAAEFEGEVIFVVARKDEPELSPVLVSTASGDYAKYSVHASFILFPISLIELQKVVRNLGNIILDRQQELVLLLFLLHTLPAIFQFFMSPMPNLCRVGYHVVDLVGFESFINDFLEDGKKLVKKVIPNAYMPETAKELVSACLQITGQLWPLLPGPIMRLDGNRLFVDFYTISQRLFYLLQLPRGGGSLPNIRAEHFELKTQDEINHSQWQPSNELKSLRGRTLYHGGKAVTDIDAIGENKGTLLCVSCKSIVYTREYDIGDYKQVRNTATLIQSAIENWKQMIDFFKVNRSGDNYDFTRFTKIIGVVCTPHVFYVPLGDATKEIGPGLFAASSIHELRQWLHYEPRADHVPSSLPPVYHTDFRPTLLEQGRPPLA